MRKVVAGVGLMAALVLAPVAHADPPPTPDPVQHAVDQANDAVTDQVMDESVWPVVDGLGYTWDGLDVLDWATD